MLGKVVDAEVCVLHTGVGPEGAVLFVLTS